ncbi:low molecular weight phosphotyrosine protein phosphatase [Vibrio sp.]|nr:low molecular weight phosphotyrosine protein phosphatase [Vibrio sp.]
MFDSILLICTGNICRSPFAEAKLKELLPGRRVDSAGVATLKSGLVGQGADPLAIEVAKEWTLDLNDHQAKQISEELVESYDLILAMESAQIERLCTTIPTARHKCFPIGYWIGMSVIEDPYKKDEHAFRQAFTNIDKALLSWAKKLG